MEQVIEKEIVTFNDIKKGYVLANDNSGIGAYTLNPRIIKVFLENPSLKDYTKCMILFIRVDGKIAGRSMFYPTRLKVEEDVVIAQSGSSLFVSPEYRHLALGLDIMRYPLESKDYPFIVYAGISKMALPMYKALRFNVFSFPQYWQPRRCDFVLKSKGLHGIPLILCSSIINVSIKCINYFVRVLQKLRLRNYIVRELNEVPEWVDEIISKDEHKYAEVHDRRWMQWTLNNNFFGKEHDKQGFFEVNKNGKILGFFMIKVRNWNLPEHNIDQVVFGSVYEWGSFDEDILNEYDIYCLANMILPQEVDIFNITTDSSATEKKIRHLFMFKHGNTHIVNKDLSKSHPDAREPSNWRMRMGYADVPFY